MSSRNWLEHPSLLLTQVIGKSKNKQVGHRQPIQYACLRASLGMMPDEGLKWTVREWVTPFSSWTYWLLKGKLPWSDPACPERSRLLVLQSLQEIWKSKKPQTFKGRNELIINCKSSVSQVRQMLIIGILLCVHWSLSSFFLSHKQLQRSESKSGTAQLPKG